MTKQWLATTLIIEVPNTEMKNGKLRRNFKNIHPNATDSQLTAFTNAIASLSGQPVTDVQLVEKSSINLAQVPTV